MGGSVKDLKVKSGFATYSGLSLDKRDTKVTGTRCITTLRRPLDIAREPTLLPTLLSPTAAAYVLSSPFLDRTVKNIGKKATSGQVATSCG